MKKAVSILLMFVAFLIIYFLQVNFFTWFNIAGVMPNLFILLIMVIGLFAGKYAGISTGVVAGLFLDIFISKKIGVTAITLGLVGFIGALLDKNFSKDSRITLVLMVTILTLLYETLNYAINAIIFSYSLELVDFFIKLVIETLFNILITIILYPLIQKCGYALEENFKERIYKDVQAQDKEVRDANIEKITEDINNYFLEKYGEEKVEEIAADIAGSIHDLEKACVREMILKEHKRPDGRKIDEIRPLSCEVGLLPRVHGSAIFTRGQTQVMSIVTLGMKSEEQMLDGIDEEEAKRYMHQYNFPPYSVGEARTSRGPGRREIGHGALAEKALVPVIPSEAEFPYAIRVVSEVLSSNGSTSQASICGSTLALMDAGVPIKKPVAGISTGLVTDKENPNNYIMLTDIQGIEDFFGDMDFKVGGTKDGITAIQVDIKIDGLTYDIIEEAFERTKIARDYILDNVMLPVISEPRADISKYAPRIMTETINPDKIKDVIGPSGKMINKIIDATGVKIDIEDDGRVFVYSTDTESGKKAMKMITDIAKDVEVGGIYDGVVTRIMSFGAFVDIGGGKEGLLHISKISSKRVDKVEDVLSVGDEITVKVVDIDNQDRINLSMKDLEVGNKIEASEEKQEK